MAKDQMTWSKHLIGLIWLALEHAAAENRHLKLAMMDKRRWEANAFSGDPRGMHDIAPKGPTKTAYKVVLVRERYLQSAFAWAENMYKHLDRPGWRKPVLSKAARMILKVALPDYQAYLKRNRFALAADDADIRMAELENDIAQLFKCL